MKIEKIVIEAPENQERTASCKKRRVAAYCRVSTDKDEQQTSFETQVRVYTEMITANPEWVFAGIYADEGITGTNAKKRPRFQQMILDCEAGKIDYIMTKSISRFARNTLECLSYVRHLQELGVQLVFEKERIDTGAVFSEMILTVLAAFAQEESRSLSENLKWGIRKRFQEGIDRWTCIYGYTKNEKGTYQIIPKEAAVVQRIFKLYEEGSSISEIADDMKAHGIASPGGNMVWKTSAVHIILKNERYAGDILLQKKYTVDHISHREVRNDCTEVPAYYIENHHTPLVSRRTYNRVQEIRAMNCQGGRNGEGSGKCVQYPFGELLRCPHCNSVLYQRLIPVQHGKQTGWCCERGETACHNFILRSWAISDAVLSAYHQLDSKTVATQLKVKNQTMADAAKMTLEIKQRYPAFERADYWWIDDLIDRISLGMHKMTSTELVRRQEKKEVCEDDRTVTVYWKCGLKTTAFSGIEKGRDAPSYLAGLYQSYLERRKTK